MQLNTDFKQKDLENEDTKTKTRKQRPENEDTKTKTRKRRPLIFFSNNNNGCDIR